MSNTPSTDSRSRIAISRPLVGAIAIGCFAAALLIYNFTTAGERTALWVASFTRAGLIMTALWIAAPTKTRAAAWANVTPATFIGLAVAIFAVAARPQFMLRLLPFFLVVAAIGYALRRRPRAGDSRPDRSTWRR